MHLSCSVISWGPLSTITPPSTVHLLFLMKCVRIYIVPSLLAFMNIPKGLIRKKLKRICMFSFKFTQIYPSRVHPVASFYFEHILHSSRHTHTVMSVPGCHWQTVQIVPGNLCLDCLWNTPCQGTEEVLQIWVCLCQVTSIRWK